MNAPFTSLFAPHIEAMLELRDGLGLKRANLESAMRAFDRYALDEHPRQGELTSDVVMGWVGDGEPARGLPLHRTRAARAFGLYLQSAGVEAFTLPGAWIRQPRPPMPHMFTDSELAALFAGCDKIGPSSRDPLRGHKAAVVFRLMLACGLRPQEARVLRRRDVDTVSLTLTVNASKGNKDRRVPFDDSVGRLLATTTR